MEKYAILIKITKITAKALFESLLWDLDSAFFGGWGRAAFQSSLPFQDGRF